MRIIEAWQYRYIEKCLYDFNTLCKSNLDTEVLMCQAIGEAINFFKDTGHGIMMEEFYFAADKHRKKLTHAAHFIWVCEDLLYTEKPNGYVIRREIIYRVAMNCYALGIFGRRH